jgi:flagellar basal-body rod protein FlgC
MATILNAIDISSKGLSIQRAKLEATAQNLANAETTETREGGPYRRKRIIVKADDFKQSFETALKAAGTSLTRTNTGHRQGKARSFTNSVELSSAEMKEVQDPKSSFRLMYDPSHPAADENGYVKMPDIEVINEMVDMMSATRAYEANTVAISSAKQMAKDALDI